MASYPSESITWSYDSPTAYGIGRRTGMVDPGGTPYELTPDGGVQLSPASPLWPLPVEPEAARRRPPA